MIVYDQRGYSLLFHVGGSVLLNTLPHALVAAGMNVALWKGLTLIDFDYMYVHLQLRRRPPSLKLCVGVLCGDVLQFRVPERRRLYAFLARTRVLAGFSILAGLQSLR